MIAIIYLTSVLPALILLALEHYSSAPSKRVRPVSLGADGIAAPFSFGSAAL
jgi:hypothetical protein